MKTLFSIAVIAAFAMMAFTFDQQTGSAGFWDCVRAALWG